ncbi:Neuromedin-U receptor 2 [Exaiptasia diaphana]|nr:Neuromedin-U receptor 2 [Exaiptasia diaphana]
MNKKALVSLKVTCVVISSIAILGNGLVAYIIRRAQSMKTPMNYIILHLAILDALTGLFTIYIQLTNDFNEVLGPSVLKQAYNQSADFVEVLCKIETLTYLGTAISPLLLTAMAYERYKAIVHPLSRLNNKVTRSRLKWILSLSWAWGIAYAIFDMCIFQYYAEKNWCDYKELGPWYSYGVYELVYTSIQFIITSITMFILYLKVILALRRQDGALATQANAQQLTNDYNEVLGPSLLKQAYNQSAPFAEVLCKIETLTYLGTSISPLLLTAMAYERYKAIVHPLSRLNNEVTRSRLKWICLYHGLGELHMPPLTCASSSIMFKKTFAMTINFLGTVMVSTNSCTQ